MQKIILNHVVVGLLLISPFLVGAGPSAVPSAHKSLCAQLDEGYCYHPSQMEDLQKEGLRILLGDLFLDTSEKSIAPKMDTRSEIERFVQSRLFSKGYTFKNSSASEFRADLPVKYALVKHVGTAHEAFLAKLMMIRQAKYTVDLTYYIFRNDETGYTLLNELKEAIRRGVSIRLMIDSLGSINPKSLTHPELKALVHFARANAGYMKDRFGQVTNQKAVVEIVSFRSVNPAQLVSGATQKTLRMLVNQFPSVLNGRSELETIYINPNRRSHDKILITDQNFPEISVAIIGGRNIANDYYRLPTPEVSTFEDLEVIVRNDSSSVRSQAGATTTDIADLYDLLYFHSGNRMINTNVASRFMDFSKHYEKMESYTKVVDKATRSEQVKLGEDFSSPDFGKRYLNDGFSAGNVDLLYTFDNVLRSRLASPLDPSEVKVGSLTYNANHINKQMEAYMAREQTHIYIVSPYLWLSTSQILKLKRWLGTAPERKLTIVTNSIVTTDNLMAQTLVDATIGPQFVVDRSFMNEDGTLGSYAQDQIEMYEYGRIDSVELGGTVHYGKMHAKGLYLEQQMASFVTTYNADPRSQYLNSEMGLFIISSEHSLRVKAQIEHWITQSHRWGSEEYYAIRRHKKLGRIKREAAANVNKIYDRLVSLGLVWLI